MKNKDGIVGMPAVVDRNISELKPYEKNAKIHKKEQIKAVANSIKSFGWVQPIVCDKKGVIIIGHARYEAAKLLGYSTAPCLEVENLSEEQIKALRLADNKLNESAWDMKLVLPELQELNIELQELTGFNSDILVLPTVKDDDIPVEKEGPPVSQLGDVYQCGNHRVMCGDSANPDHVAKLLAGEKPILMVTDPPYGVNYDPSWREGANLGVGKRSKGKVMNDDKIDWTQVFSMFDPSILYVWHAAKYSSEVGQGIIDLGYDIISQIIWKKQHFVLSRGDYHWQHEPCWYAVKMGKNHNWQGLRDQSTVWDIANNNSFGNKQKEKTWGHGTQKPVECMQRAILNSSKAKEKVCDPFLGSGTTLIACEKTNRVSFGMELDPKYMDIIIQRWEEFTGQKAILLTK